MRCEQKGIEIAGKPVVTYVWMKNVQRIAAGVGKGLRHKEDDSPHIF